VQHGRNNPAVSKHSKALKRKIFAFCLLPFDFRVAALGGAAMMLLVAKPSVAINEPSPSEPNLEIGMGESFTKVGFLASREEGRGDAGTRGRGESFSPKLTGSTDAGTWKGEDGSMRIPSVTATSDRQEEKKSESTVAEKSHWLAQMPSSPNGVMFPQPEIIIKSNGTPTPDILQPTVQAAPTLPRAVAPPVGDMAISNIDASFDKIDLGTTAIVPRLVLRQAPAREVLAVLARYAGMNVVFLDDAGTAGANEQQNGQQNGQAAPTQAGGPAISLDLQNEPVQEVFNSVLMVSGLKANRRGQTIFVGSRLPDAARRLVNRSIRINQAKAEDVAGYLSLQGAQTNVLIPSTRTTTRDTQTGLVTEEITEPKIVPLIVEQTNSQASGALPLAGLLVSADTRLNSVNLVGEPRLVEMATSLITQLDARRRQVAVNVKVVDVNLLNTQNTSSSFSFGVNDSFFVQDQGTAILRFGTASPVTGETLNSATGQVSNPPVIQNPFSGSPIFLNPNAFVPILGTSPGNTIIDSRTGQIFVGPQGSASFFQPNAAVSTNPLSAGFTNITPATNNVITINPDGTTSIAQGALGTATAALASLFQYPKQFLAKLQAQIVSGNAKILTDPTLVVQEGQEAQVKLTQQVVSSVNTQVDPLSGVRTTTPVISDAGLTLGVNVQRIDDNGFVSLSVTPVVSAPGQTLEFDSGNGARNTLTLLNSRALQSGLIRLRDGETLVLSGIIQESDRSTVSKVPILGDIPILGALFRSNTDTTDRKEVIILLTPQMIDDNPGSPYGFNYAPGRDASQMLQQQGFPTQRLP
jgi:type IV pilus assembly protein PilQ